MEKVIIQMPILNIIEYEIFMSTNDIILGRENIRF